MGDPSVTVSVCLARFVSIQQRPGVRVVISEKFVEIFNWYEGDLEEIQRIYERHKVQYRTGTGALCILRTEMHKSCF